MIRLQFLMFREVLYIANCVTAHELQVSEQ